MLFLGVKPKVSHKWFRKTICSVDINYPMHRYIYKSDLTDEICGKYKFSFKCKIYADEIDGMPADDNTNYVVLAQLICV